MNRKINNYWKIGIILLLSILFILINSNISMASYRASDATTTVGSNVSVSITATEGVQHFDISIAELQGFTFSSVSTLGISNGGSVSYAGLGSPITNLATYNFKAPSTPGTYTISFNVDRSTVNSTIVVNTANSNTGTSSGGSSSGGTSSTGNTSGGSTTSNEKSSNANLSNLGIRPNDFSGFTPNTTTYKVTVPEEVESVEVYATAAHSKATIAGTGNKALEYGENALNVVVTAEDGTTKTYTINVTREGEEETEEETEIINGLSNISISGLQLTPSFKADVYEYKVNYIGKDTSLDIQTVATDPNYTVEILGNEELKEGENTITILVTDVEGNNVATYQLTVNKSLVDKEALAKEEEEKQKQEQRKIFLIAGGIIVVILVIIVIIVIKRRRNRAYAEEFSGVPFAGINGEDDYYEDDYYENNQDEFDEYGDESVNEQSGFLGEENTIEEDLTPTEETSEEGNQEMSNQPEFDDSQEKREKERAKRDFLEGYNVDYVDEYQEDRPSRGKRKGKRFK